MPQVVLDDTAPRPIEALPAGDIAAGEAPGAAKALPPEPSVSGRSIAGSVALSVAVMAVVGYVTFDPGAFGELARHLNPWLLAVAAATVVLRVAFGAWRLRHYSGGRLGVRGSVRAQIVWDFFAYVTPSTVGGGPIMPVFLARDRQLSLGEATSVILFSMLVDQICFALTIPALLIAATQIDVFPQALGTAGTAALGLLFCGYLAWVVLLAYGTLVRPDRLARLVGGVFQVKPLRRFRTGALRAMAETADRSRALRARSAGFHLKGFAITLVPWLCRYALAVFVIWSVVPGVDAGLAFARAAALQVGALAVPTPGGSGGVEGLYVLFLGPLMPKSLVAPTLLVWRLMSFYVFLAVGFVLVARHMRRRAAASRPASEISNPEVRPAVETLSASPYSTPTEP